MAEVLTLTTPIAQTAITTFRVKSFAMNSDAPSIKTLFEDNNGKDWPWLFVVDEDTTVTQVKNAISFINQAKYKTIQGKSLQKFLIHEAQDRGVLPAGTVSGTED